MLLFNISTVGSGFGCDSFDLCLIYSKPSLSTRLSTEFLVSVKWLVQLYFALD